MLINFALTQFMPGGPIESVIAKVQGEGDVLKSVTGGFGDAGMTAAGRGRARLCRRPRPAARVPGQAGSADRLCPDRLRPTATPANPTSTAGDGRDCHKEPIPAAERFLIMMGKYLRFDFGESYFRSISVVDLVLEKMPVSITLGLWSTLIAYLISIPLGIRKAVRDGTPVRHLDERAIIIAAYAIPGFLFAILLIVLFAGGSYWKIFPLRGPDLGQLGRAVAAGKVVDYLWHIACRSSAQHDLEPLPR
jgi:microcin C transport system permease protein